MVAPAGMPATVIASVRLLKAPTEPGNVTVPELTVVGPTAPPVAVIAWGLPPRHALTIAGLNDGADGVRLYVTEAVVVFTQPAASVPVTV